MLNQEQVPTADFVRNIGYWQERALTQPISITHHGRPRFVLQSHASYEDMLAKSEDGAAPDEPHQPTHESAAELDGVLAHMREHYILLDSELNIVRLNRGAAEYFGLTASDVVGKRLSDRVPAIKDSPVQQQVIQVRTTREPITFQQDSSVQAGVRLNIHVYPHGDGVAVLFENITRSLQETHKLEELRAYRANAVAGAPFFALELDQFGKITSASDAFLATTGFSQARIKGHTASDLIAPPDRRLWRDTIETVLTERTTKTFQVTLLRRNGETLPLSCAVSSIRDGFGVRGAVVLAVGAPPQMLAGDSEAHPA